MPIAPGEEASFATLIPGMSAAGGDGVDSYKGAALVLNILQNIVPFSLVNPKIGQMLRQVLGMRW